MVREAVSTKSAKSTDDTEDRAEVERSDRLTNATATETRRVPEPRPLTRRSRNEEYAPW